MYQIIDRLIKSGTNPENILYFNFDEPMEKNDVSVIEDVFATFMELKNPKGRKYLFFDEIQNIRQWEKWLKKYYDLKSSGIKFVVTGSNQSMLSENLSNLLTGRVFSVTVFPLSFMEFLDFTGVQVADEVLQKSEIKHHLSRYMNDGGFPEAALEKDAGVKKERLRQYFDSIILRDIASSRKIRETSKLIELSEYLMSNISSLMSYKNISNAIGINQNTLKEYMYFMENAYLLFQVAFFSYSVKESISIQKPRKVYCIDNGLRNASAFKFSADEGKLAENLVYIELKRRGNDVFYWNGRNEVDFIVKNDDHSLSAINVSYSNEILEREKKSLLEFRDAFGGKVKDFLIITDDAEGVIGGIKLVPLWKWLLSGPDLKPGNKP
jgi:hypothetical protein